MRTRGLPSPDWADMLALTFASPHTRRRDAHVGPFGRAHWGRAILSEPLGEAEYRRAELF